MFFKLFFNVFSLFLINTCQQHCNLLEWFEKKPTMAAARFSQDPKGFFASRHMFFIWSRHGFALWICPKRVSKRVDLPHVLHDRHCVYVACSPCLPVVGFVTCSPCLPVVVLVTLSIDLSLSNRSSEIDLSLSIKWDRSLTLNRSSVIDLSLSIDQVGAVNAHLFDTLCTPWPQVAVGGSGRQWVTVGHSDMWVQWVTVGDSGWQWVTVDCGWLWVTVDHMMRKMLHTWLQPLSRKWRSIVNCSCRNVHPFDTFTAHR